MSDERRLSGWQNQQAERRAAMSSRMKRFHRWKALQRGEADPMFEPFSKRLTPGFQEALDRYMAERKQAAE